VIDETENKETSDIKVVKMIKLKTEHNKKDHREKM
jgi:hypothetical protein